jgi:hypothetical protein
LETPLQGADLDFLIDAAGSRWMIQFRTRYIYWSTAYLIGDGELADRVTGE